MVTEQLVRKLDFSDSSIVSPVAVETPFIGPVIPSQNSAVRCVTGTIIPRREDIPLSPDKVTPQSIDKDMSQTPDKDMSQSIDNVTSQSIHNHISQSSDNDRSQSPDKNRSQFPDKDRSLSPVKGRNQSPDRVTSLSPVKDTSQSIDKGIVWFHQGKISLEPLSKSKFLDEETLATEKSAIQNEKLSRSGRKRKMNPARRDITKSYRYASSLSALLNSCTSGDENRNLENVNNVLPTCENDKKNIEDQNNAPCEHEISAKETATEQIESTEENLGNLLQRAREFIQSRSEACSIIKPTATEPITQATVGADELSPKSIKPAEVECNKKLRDITKSRKYTNSLSALLGNVLDQEENECENISTEEINIKSIDDSVVKQEFSRMQHRLHNPEWMQISKQQRAPEKLEEPNKPPSKRPCPTKLKQPTLKKTTSKLFKKIPNNYLKGCKWSPDGLALMTTSRDKVVRIFNVPDVSSDNEQAPTATNSTANIVYDYCWNPNINHLQAKSCDFLMTCKDNPIQLVNAFTGTAVASYTAFDAMDVLTAAFSVCYMSSTTILGGYCKCVRLFDISRPGRESTVLEVGDFMHRNNNSIVSSITPSPSMPDVFAGGCYNATVALYSTQIQGPLQSFAGPSSGVTQLTFSQDGRVLYCGSRMENAIYSWDTRQTSEVLQVYPRTVKTNQRIQFDIKDTLLVTGNHDGMVTMYDTVSGEVLEFSAHCDTVNGVSLHPHWGMLATASGRRHFHINDEEKEENSLKIWTC